jgi:hypothetical protein
MPVGLIIVVIVINLMPMWLSFLSRRIYLLYDSSQLLIKHETHIVVS